MIAFSTVQYARYSLTNDFGGYAQAWDLIGHGHLNPYVSVFRSDFLHNNLDLMMYPLALLGRLFPNPVMLSWAQDAAIVATEVVTLAWVRDYIRSRREELGSTAPVLLIGTAALLAVDPWSWETSAFSLHFGAFATLFAVLTARDLWRGRFLRMAIWVPLAMTSAALGSLYIVAAAAGVLLTRSRDRRTHLVAGAVLFGGIAGLITVTELHLLGRSGATLQGTYGYLIGARTSTITPPTLAAGLLHHLGAAISVVRSHSIYIVGYLLAGGLTGIATGSGLAALMLIILPNALSSQTAFIAFPGAFQSWPAQPFLVFGSLVALASLACRQRTTHGRVALMRRSLPLVAGATVLAAMELISLPHKWLVGTPSANDLAALNNTIPSGSVVYADQNTIGRLSMRRTAYAYVAPSERIQVGEGSTWVVVAPSDVPPTILRILSTDNQPLFGRLLYNGIYWHAYLFFGAVDENLPQTPPNWEIAG